MAANNEPKKEKNKRIIHLILFVLYLLVMCYLVFFAEQFGRVNTGVRTFRYNIKPFKEIMRFYRVRHQYPMGFLLNVVGNIVAFMPFGYFLPRIHTKCKNGLLTVLHGFFLSLTIEVIQLLAKIGCFDVDDLILNTAGVLLGFLLGWLIGKFLKKES